MMKMGASSASIKSFKRKISIPPNTQSTRNAASALKTITKTTK